MAGEARPLTAVDASGEPLEALDLEAEEENSITRQRQRPSRLRWAALLSVPMLWGSFTPTMKLLLNVHRPPPALVTNLCSHVVGAVTLCIITLVTRPPPHCLGSTARERRRMLRASLELGVYLFFGQLTQLLGLQGTTATVNAVLVQASVVIVPLFDTAEAPVRKASRLAIVAARLLPSLIALGGVIVLTSAPSAEGAGTALKQDEVTLGIVYSLISAVCYAMHTMRLSEYADVDATAQASGQVLVNALLDVAAMPVAAMLTTANEGSWLASAPREALRRLALAACWNGVFVVGATTWAMSFAQQAFSASTAALAYAMEPLFAALFAAAILHESIHELQLLGGTLVVLANVLVAVGSTHVLSCFSRHC